MRKFNSMEAACFMDHFCLIFILIQICVTTDTSCPTGCTCEGVVWKSVSCSNSLLMTIPPNLDIHVEYVNVSYNRIGNINGKSLRYMKAIKSLDVSHNYIEMIEDIPDTITVLNVSSNLISTIPVGLPLSLKVLKLSHNEILTLYASSICYLHNLRTLILNNNKINKLVIDHNVSDCNTEYLILSDNNLENIQADMFSSFKKLKYLDLSRNNIKSVETGTFYDFSALRYLSLSQNMLKFLPQKLPIMEWFDVSRNKISKISEDQHSDLYPHDVFLIGQNPLHCDCDLLWLKEFFDTKKYQLKFLDVNTSLFIPQCSTPDSLHGKDWNNLPDDVFKCLNSDSTNQEGDNKHEMEDLNVTVNTTGENFVTVEWKLGDVRTKKNSDLVLIKIHPFGEKHLRKYYSVNLDKRRYTIKSLNPNTPYIICAAMVTGETSQSDISKYDGKCIEVKTVINTTLLSWMQVILQYFVILFVGIVALKICLMSVKFFLQIVYKKKYD